MRSEYAAIFLSAVGLYVFCCGFLLTRTTFDSATACFPDFASSVSTLPLRPFSSIPDYFESVYPKSSGPPSLVSPSASTCAGVPPLVDSIAIVIVDALRIDFAVNSLPRTIPALTERSSFGTHRQLLKFHSDPPTVTTQRLQALTTGGLPTFGDVRSSFDAGKVTEDSWLNQLRLQRPNASIFFAGDDTWTKLFPPSYFTSSHPFPSFNTRDIDTVDKGIESVLDEMKSKPDWKVSILHFLGVDHVGHTFGPDSPEMTAKLAYMDDVLTDSNLSNPSSDVQCTVSFTFGDHGMTSTGNHGGGSEDETTAGLYASYSSACHFPASPLDGSETATSSDFTTISQVDIVPTISFLLSLPIPYASIGSVATNLIPNTDSVQMTGLLLLNCAQVHSYLKTYGASSYKLHSKISHLDDILKDAIETLEEAVTDGGGDSIKLRSAANQMKRYLNEATESGREVWTQFGDVEMILGVGLMLFAVLISLAWPSRSHAAFPMHTVHDGLLAFLTLFLTILIPLSNSYIDNAQDITMYSITLVFVITMLRDLKKLSLTAEVGSYLVVPLLCRCLEDFTGGHGKLESLWHSTYLQIPITTVLIIMRIIIHKQLFPTATILNPTVDVLSIVLLTLSWSFPSTELCYTLVKCSFGLSSVSLLASFVNRSRLDLSFSLAIIWLIVTGPSGVLTILICLPIFNHLSSDRQFHPVMPYLISLHIFYSSEHATGMHGLQYNSSFVDGSEFSFYKSGFLLFLNTFTPHVITQIQTKPNPTLYLASITGSSFSVYLFRRHLMIFGVFAPYWCFACIFAILSFGVYVLEDLFGGGASKEETRKKTK